MRFQRDCQPEKCASKDEYRQNLRHAYLDVEHARLVATDGHMLVSLPIVVEEHDTSGPVTADALKAARKASKASKATDATVQANGALVIPGAASFPRPSLDGAYPPYEQVIPAAESATFRIGLDASYLAELAKALGTDYVIVEFSGPMDPIRVLPESGDGAIGVLMPRRMS